MKEVALKDKFSKRLIENAHNLVEEVHLDSKSAANKEAILIKNFIFAAIKLIRHVHDK